MRKNKPKLKPPRPAASSSPMDVELLRRMVHLMSANDLNTVDVRDGDKRVILKRGAVQPTISMAPFSPLQHTTPPYASYPAPSAQPTHVTAAAPATVAEEASLLAIKSPMVGTFYAAPSKGAKPFVTVGTVVDEETDVCIVEAMKVFNNIKAECRGTISKILVNDGQSVEFGQTMFLVKPS